MTRFLFFLAWLIFPALAHAQTNPTPNWCSYQETGNPSCIQTSTDVAAAIGQRVYAAGGMSTNQTLAAPTVNGGSANGVAITGGTVSGSDVSGATTTAANSIATGTTARTPAERAMSMPQPHDFLASGQTVAQLIGGQIDVGSILNTMIAKGIGSIYLPCGTYKVLTTIGNLPNYTSLIGAGSCTILSVQNATGDVIDSDTASFVRISNLQIRAGVTRTGGYAIHFHDTFHSVVDHVYLTNGTSGHHYSGIRLEGANDTHVNDIEMRGGDMTKGVGFLADGTDRRSEDTYVTHTNISGFHYGVQLQWSSGTYLSNMDILGSGWDGIIVNPASGQEIDGLRANQVLSDSNLGNGWEFTGSGPITETAISNSWGSCSGGYCGGSTQANSSGMVIGSTLLNNFTLINSEFHGNSAHGIDVEAGSNILIQGNSVFQNSKAQQGIYNGILVNSGPSYVNVSFNIGGHGGVAATGGETNYQAYGLKTVSTEYITAIGNLFNTNQTGAVSIASGSNVINLGNGGN